MFFTKWKKVIYACSVLGFAFTFKSCFDSQKTMLPAKLPLIAKSGFKVPNYAINIAKRSEWPKDVFYFEIPYERLDVFLKYIEKYEHNCYGVMGGIISTGQDYIHKFSDSKVRICHRKFVDEDGDGMPSHESLLVSKADPGENTSVFYAYWDD